jgi:aryl-alcohol dehydrogenase-like predicted oxidoreductase
MRPFGKTKVQVSALGLGGHHLGEAASVEVAIRIVHAAIDGGVTFFDNCWEYYNGRSENWLGRALVGKRDKVFLMSKVCTHGRGKALARTMLEESLRRLGTDHLDLWQIHAVSYDNDPELAYARGGAIEALDEAKRAGKVRFVGFTGHKDPAIHLRMLRLGYPFDSVQMPLNPFDAGFHTHSFERLVLPELLKRGIAPLGMKPLGGTASAIKNGVLGGEDALRYAMSLPVAVTICGMETVEVAQGFRPLAAEAMDAIRKTCAEFAPDGRYEPYKVSLKYDNPETRLPHGFPVESTNKEMKEMFQEAGEKPK